MLAAKPDGLAEHHIARAGIDAVRIGSPGADDQVGEAVAVDVAGRGHRDAALVARRRAAELEAGRAVERREIDVGGKARSLAEHHVARAGDTLGSAEAPTIRSAKPSPLMSPAEATEMPLSSPSAAPLSLKPVAPSSVERSMLACQGVGELEALDAGHGVGAVGRACPQVGHRERAAGRVTR